ncbi:hypothetical protein NFH98_12905 [Halomonas sp. H33-56]|uniref:hypothetical protein n=1 Tax=Halomonas sp. H33-56 TaxID=2950873 RepID=UPI0032DE83AD
MNQKLESTLVGVAGEYFVAAELSARGNIASISLRNSRGIDIIASDSNANNTVTIQVKTNSSGKSSWILSKKSESFVSESHFYIFVRLHDLGNRPTFHIVPSEYVARCITEGHANWLMGKKRDGSERKDSNMRKFEDPLSVYKERWDLLAL